MYEISLSVSAPVALMAGLLGSMAVVILSAVLSKIQTN